MIRLPVGDQARSTCGSSVHPPESPGLRLTSALLWVWATGQPNPSVVLLRQSVHVQGQPWLRLLPSCLRRYVTAAKSLVAGRVAIDMLAGPSECLVIADETASAQVVAADLLAQARADPRTVPPRLERAHTLLWRNHALSSGRSDPHRAQPSL